MTLRLTLLASLAAACGKDPGPGTTARPTSTSEPPTVTATGPEVHGEGISVVCTEQLGNKLRWDCAVEATTDGPVTLTWVPAEGGVTRTATSPAGTSHVLTAWGLRQRGDYAFTVSGADGTLEGVLSTRRHQLETRLDVTGESTLDHVLVSLPCMGDPAVAIVATDGEVVWYQDTDQPDLAGVGGYHYGPDDTVVLFLNGSLLEFALDGTVLRRFTRGVDFDRPIHHDVFKAANGYIYALNANRVTYEGTDYVMDGVYVFGDDGVVASWDLADHLDPIGDSGGDEGFWGFEFPGAIDWSHGNSVTVDESGTMWLSFRWLSAAYQLRGDPDRADFGEIDWILVGNPASPVKGDFAMDAVGGLEPDFIGQHHVNPTPDGRLALFDNRSGSRARGVVLSVDEAARVATIEEGYETGLACFAQGSTYPLPSGNRLVTCATSGLLMEFSPTRPDPVWTMQLACGENQGYGQTMVARGIPVALPAAE